MTPTAWLRVLLGGVAAGVAWYLLSAVLLSLFAGPFLEWARTAGSGAHWNGGIWFVIDLAMGVWVAWLYAVLVPRYGSRLRTAGAAGLAWWVLKTLQSAKWAGLGLIPADLVLAPLLVSLMASLGAAAVAAWLYDGMGRKAAERPQAQGPR